MEEFNLFPTVIRGYDFSKDPDLKLLNDVIDNQKTESHRLVGWAQSSYGTRKNLLDNPVLRGIKNRIQECIDDHTKAQGLAPVKITNSWFNRLGNGQRVELHRHEMSVISGAFYTRVDPGSVGLRLHSPISQMRMFENIVVQQMSNANFVDLKCETGILFLFPSWLEHSSEPNTTNERVTVSFNTTYQSKD